METKFVSFMNEIFQREKFRMQLETFSQLG